MNQVTYAVMHVDGSWILGFGGRRFEQFASKQEELSKALQWARNAPQRQNIMLRVSLEHEDGRTDFLEPTFA
jgi:hypothetical protein